MYQDIMYNKEIDAFAMISINLFESEILIKLCLWKSQELWRPLTEASIDVLESAKFKHLSRFCILYYVAS